MAPDHEKIVKKMKNKAAVHLYDSIDSTNDEAKRRAALDCGAHLYAASRQTAGRGRRGHSFYSPEGTGLYMTLSLPCSCGQDIQLLTCAAAVAVCEAVEALSPVKPRIKWVNDIFVDGKKAAGILTELVCDSDNRPVKVIVGIGVNLCTEDFPEEFAAAAGNLGDVEPEALCAAITDRLLTLYEHPGDPAVIEGYRRRSLCLGKIVHYTKNGVEHTARAVDIAPDGGLVIEEDEKNFTLHSGEISVVMQSDP